MTALQGQVNGMDISNKIYLDIMNITPSRRAFSNRTCSAKSASTQISFNTSPRHSAKSKASQSSKQEVYSDFDIIKNRSWSGSRLKNATLVKSATRRTDSPRQSHLLSPVLSDNRSLLSPGRAPGTSSSTGDSRGQQLNTREVWNLKGSQVQRLHQEWAAIDHCRAMKRASEMVQHRLDPMYRISGSNIPLLERYQVNDSELERLREMTETSRILQLDLKRIKYPQTARSPKREKRKGGKSRGLPQLGDDADVARSMDNADAAEPDNAQREMNDNVTSPLSKVQPNARDKGQVQPLSSPVSTPEATPRFFATEAEGESVEQGEVSQKEEIPQEEDNL